MEKIAIVDDDSAILEVFSQILSVFGYQPCPYNNPLEALSRIPQEKPQTALILLDMMMVPITGLQFLDERRKSPTLKSIPVIILSAWDLPEKDRKHFGSEVAGVIKKPVLAKDLADKIRIELNRKGLC